jgi:3-deoxy-manno-octulosonate cytidylyltransferase (CMP-KDO synthetase)
MIVHVWRRAMEADLGPVVVATDSTEIAGAIEAAARTGSPRCWAPSIRTAGTTLW